MQGICVLNDPRVAEMSDLKFFLEVEEEECRSRREERGVWGEPAEVRAGTGPMIR